MRLTPTALRVIGGTSWRLGGVFSFALAFAPFFFLGFFLRRESGVSGKIVGRSASTSKISRWLWPSSWSASSAHRLRWWLASHAIRCASRASVSAPTLATAKGISPPKTLGTRAT